MAVDYCLKCGKKHTYTIHAPNFCSKCGEPLSDSNINVTSNASSLPSQEKKQRRTRSSYENSRKTQRYEHTKNVDNNLNEYLEGSVTFDPSELPKLDKLEIEVDMSNFGPRQFKLKDTKDIESAGRQLAPRKEIDSKDVLKNNMSDLNNVSRHSI